MDLVYRNELKELCVNSGFTPKRQSYFRLIGDGVLQVIKCRYELRLHGYVVFIGLFSMYGVLEPQWFTASGCIPRYSVTNCYDQNNKPLTFAAPMRTQLEMLRNQVLPWLDSIDTQKKLIRAILKLDPRWNDSLKIGPYVACGQYNHGKKVIREILFQHDFARSNGPRFTEGSDGMLYLDREQEDDDFMTLLDMLSREDSAEITAYLQKNYARNMEYAKFCLPKGRKQKTPE